MPEPLLQRCQVCGRPIGERPIGLSPDELRGVELGGVGREGVDMESGMVAEEGLDFLAAVNGSPVPQQDHRPPQMPEQVAEERPDLQPGEVPRAALDIQGQPLAAGRHRQTADGREPVPAVAVVQQRDAAFGRPGPMDIRDEQEAAFVHEDEMGPKCGAFFLSGARSRASTVRAAQFEFGLSHADAVSSNHNVLAGKFAEFVGKYSDGRIKITVYPGGQLGS